MTPLGRSIVHLVAVGIMLGSVADASAATARHYFEKGHRYDRHAYRHRHYGPGPAIGAAVAGTALGIIGAAAGAAAADRYDDYPAYAAPGYYGPGYAAPGYDAPGYGYGYDGGYTPY